MNDIGKSYQAAVQCLPADLRWQASDRTSTRDARGSWALRDSSGQEIAKAQVGNDPEANADAELARFRESKKPASVGFVVRSTEQTIAHLDALHASVVKLAGRVHELERRLAEVDGDTAKALPDGLLYGEPVAVPLPRARWSGAAWVEVD